MKICLLRKRATGEWLSREGWTDDVTFAYVYTENVASLEPKDDCEWVQFVEGPPF